ncbi:MAG: hypothetical protein CTY24_04190 [Methylobacter sp.]|nr:MAG: hypothetical protein CTY24_04190 [Methylobacter sp.]
MSQMLLQTIEEAGVAVLTLCEGIEESEFAKSRLTRQEVCRQLGILGIAAHDLAPSMQAALPEIDWASWSNMAESEAKDNPKLWQVISVLVPETLMWLRVYRNQQPELFRTASV